jgi:hypothetical protein
MTTYDLEKAFAHDAEREQLLARGGSLAMLLARLGAYWHHPQDETDYHDQKGYGYPTANARLGRIVLDPSLPFAAYEHLIPCGPRVRELIAAHPSTTQKPMSDARVSLELTDAELGTRPTYRPGLRGQTPEDKLHEALILASQRGDRRCVVGSFAPLLYRAGAFNYEFETVDGVLEHLDWSKGEPAPNIVRHPAVPPDPTLPWEELRKLTYHGAFAEALIAAHPSKRGAIYSDR